MAVRAKFTVQSIIQYTSQRIVKLIAVTDDGIPENVRYHKYTPQGSIELTIDNPPAAEQFVPGKEFYVDFTLVE